MKYTLTLLNPYPCDTHKVEQARTLETAKLRAKGLEKPLHTVRMRNGIPFTPVQFEISKTDTGELVGTFKFGMFYRVKGVKL